MPKLRLIDRTQPEESFREPGFVERTLARTGTRLAEPLGIAGSLAQAIPEGARKLTGIPFLPEKGNVPLTSLLGQVGDVIEAGRKGYQFFTGNEAPQIEVPLPFPTQEGITEKAEEFSTKRYGTPEVIRPQNVVERITDRIAGYLPQSVTMSALFKVPLGLLNLATSATSGQLLEEAGFGPLVQSLGELGTSALTSIIKSKIPFNTAKGAKELQDISFEKGKSLGKTIPLKDPEAVQHIRNLNDKVKQFPELYQKQTQDIVKKLDKFLRSGSLSAHGAWDIKQRIDKLYKHGGSEAPIYQELRSVLDNSLKKLGLEHPEFGKHYMIANDVTVGLKNYDKAINKVKNSPDLLKKFSTPVAATMFFYGLGKGGIGTMLKKAGMLYAAEKTAKPLASYIKSADALYKSSATVRNIMTDLTKEALYKDKNTLTRLITNLNDAVLAELPTSNKKRKIRLLT